MTALIDTFGTAVERYEYDVWGVILDVIDSDGSSTEVASWTLVGNPWCYTGRQFEFEERTGLYHYRARDYRPEAGQFLQRDPLGVWVDHRARGSSKAYVSSNPVSRIDPTGLIDESGVNRVPRVVDLEESEFVKEVTKRGLSTVTGFLDKEFDLDCRARCNECIMECRVTFTFTIYRRHKDDEAFWERAGKQKAWRSIILAEDGTVMTKQPKTAYNTERHEHLHIRDHLNAYDNKIRDMIVRAEQRPYTSQSQCEACADQLRLAAAAVIKRTSKESQARWK